MAKGTSPIVRCPKCGAPHGGSQGALCPECAAKAKK
jgi:rubrerythrin